MVFDFVAIGSICVGVGGIAYFVYELIRQNRRSTPLLEPKKQIFFEEPIPTAKLIEIDLHRRLHEFRNTKFARLPQRNNVIPFRRPTNKVSQ